jgi:hypothetical protein
MDFLKDKNTIQGGKRWSGAPMDASTTAITKKKTGWEEVERSTGRKYYID